MPTPAYPLSSDQNIEFNLRELFDEAEKIQLYSNQRGMIIDNIMLNALDVSKAGSIPAHAIVSGAVDSFQDETGIDLTASSEELYNAVDKYYTPTGAMVLVSKAFDIIGSPDRARLVIKEMDADPVTINTDLKAYVSRDGGANWNQVNLLDVAEYNGMRILSGESEVSGSFVSMKWKIETYNGKSLSIHGTGITWS